MDTVNPVDYVTASELLTQARVAALNASPFFGYIMLSVETRLDQNVHIAGVDNNRLYINPGAFCSFNIKERVFLLAHEVMHIALRHVGRRQWRENKLWNIACDVVVNEILMSFGMSMPTLGLTKAYIKTYFNISLPDTLELTPEEIYNLIKDVSPESSFSESGYYDLLNDNNNAGNKSSTASDSSNKDPNKDSDDTGSSLDVASLGIHWKGILSSAFDYSNNRQHGTMPAWLSRELNITQPKITWQSLLRMFVGSVISDARSFKRPARRHLHRLCVLPGYGAFDLKLVVVIDASASINSIELGMFVSELNGIVSSGNVTVTLITHDAEVTEIVEEVENMPIPKHIKGGGGTLFYPVTEAIFNRQMMPDGVVWLTDGFGEYPESQPDYPVLWVMTPSHQAPPWGWKIILDNNPQEVKPYQYS